VIAAHADVVGSLLRPPELLRARSEIAAGRMTPAAFKAIEDKAVDRAVRLQEEAGLEVVTDGEMRRLSFQSQMTEAVAGFGSWDLDAFVWGEWHGVDGAEDWRRERPHDIAVVGKLVRARHLSAEEFVYLRAYTRRMPKVTLPSPGLFVNFWSAEKSRDAYPTLDEFLADVVRILREEVEELARLGATYIQIDAPHYPLLLDPKTRAFYESRGWAFEEWLERGVELDNAVMEPIPGVTFGFHLCRGNQKGRWLVEGGYEAIAEPIFRGIRAHRLLLEYDDARSGSFSPLTQLPDDRIAVLGLVSTKRPEIEDAEVLIRRIDEAARYVDKDRLALSPQCGFSTSIIGNELTIADQDAKLRLVADTARRVWG
jgi:5-methyltetrahydropteroyltriglutamate--homocysteine methyltransferase